VMTRVDPFRFYPDPQASSMDDANYFIEARSMSLQELERRWPGSVSKLNGEYEDEALDEREDIYRQSSKVPMANPGGVSGVSTQWGRPGAGRNPGSKSHAEDQGVSVYEAWIRENNHYTNDDGDIYVDDSWRVIVVAGNHVVMNEAAKDIWSHAKHPYSRLVFNELGEFWGISLVEHLAPLQFSINRLLAAIQSNAELIGNPVMVEDNRSGVQRTKVVNKPGQRITKAAGSEFGWLDPPEMPNYISDLVRFYIGEMERVSGLSAIVRGATPTGRNAQGVLDSVQEAAFVRVRNALRNVEYTLGEAGNLISSLIVENYTQPRMVAVVGDSGAKSSLALAARHFTVATEQGAVPLQYQLWVQAGSSLPISRQARAQEADTLFAMGALDHQAILEAHDYPNRDEIVKRITAMQAAGMMQEPSARSAAGRTH